MNDYQFAACRSGLLCRVRGIGGMSRVGVQVRGTRHCQSSALSSRQKLPASDAGHFFSPVEIRPQSAAISWRGEIR